MMIYMEHEGIPAALGHGGTAHEGSSGPCAWEPGIYRGKDKRATNVIKEPVEVGLNVSMLAVKGILALMTMVVKTSGT